MSCVIMQPTYLPWAGYFNLMVRADDFVFLDDVQFKRRSWQCRNRILLHGVEHLLTVPVRKAPRDTPITAIRISDDEDWRKAHAAVLQEAYRHAPHGDAMLGLLLPLIGDRSVTLLAQLTSSVIEALCGVLRVSPRVHWASELACPGKRSERLARICERLGHDHYLAAAGSREYLEADDFQRRYGKSMEIQAFPSRPYPQLGGAGFVSHLSVVDLLANVGADAARAYIRESGP